MSLQTCWEPPCNFGDFFEAVAKLLDGQEARIHTKLDHLLEVHNQTQMRYHDLAERTEDCLRLKKMNEMGPASFGMQDDEISRLPSLWNENPPELNIDSDTVSRKSCDQESGAWRPHSLVAAEKFAAVLATDEVESEQDFEDHGENALSDGVVRVTANRYFDYLCALVILVHVGLATVDLEMALQDPPEEGPWKSRQLFFCAFYTFEVVFKVAVSPKRFVKVETVPFLSSLLTRHWLLRPRTPTDGDTHRHRQAHTDTFSGRKPSVLL